MYQTILDNENLTVDDVLLEPKEGILRSRCDATVAPFIYPSPMDTVTGYAMANAMLNIGEFVIVPRSLPEPELMAIYNDFGDHPNCFLACGSSMEAMYKLTERVERSAIRQGTINVCIDIAHGWSVQGLEAVRVMHSSAAIHHIMSGSIATASAVAPLVNAGATHLRVGIGPGSMCTTRLMTGVGVPQLTAVYQIAQRVSFMHDSTDSDLMPSRITVIADGGIRMPGDAVKYLAAGADAIMMGSLFSICAESPGWEVDEMDHPPVGKKRYRGHASAEYQKDHYGKSHACPEGVSTDYFKWDGTRVDDVVNKFRGGLRSAISYLGLQSSEELNPKNVTFLKATPSVLNESRPHGSS